jgi:ribosomal protein S18 acetylase RimI-like enzyme
MEIREARPEEFAAAGEVAVEGYRDFYGRRLGDYGERLRDIDSRAAGAVVLVAVEDGEILGTVTYVPDSSSPFAQHVGDGEASIRMLSIEPRHKRRGVGKALSLACIERARSEGRRAIVLHADDIMEGAQRLYEGLGFRRDPSRDFEPDEDTLLLCYVLDL